MIKGIFHCSDFHLAKDMGFTHVEVSYTAGRGHGSYPAMSRAIREAHDLGLGCMIAPFNHDMINVSEGLNFLDSVTINLGDFVALSDEPNDRWIHPHDIRKLNDAVKKKYNLRTAITLTCANNALNYANTCDILMPDFYRKMTWYRAIPLACKIKRLQKLHDGKIIAVLPIRYSPAQIKKHHEFWWKLGIWNQFWYSATPTQEKPPWADKDLADHEEFKAAIKEFL